MSINSDVFGLFPHNTHSLFLVSDPDGLLSDESVLTTITERGFTLIQEADPILLRYRVEQVKPFDAFVPVIIVTDGALEALPYDLWQQGHRVSLALHTFFPNLSYPIVRLLTPTQRARLSQVVLPGETLGERRTIEFLLEHVFRLQPNLLQQSAYFILWLDDYHQSLAPLPAPIFEYVLAQLHKISKYNTWPLEEILKDHQAYKSFVQDQWNEFLSVQTGRVVGERKAEYLLHFENNYGLQDALPHLLRSGSLTPVQVETESPVPNWVMPGICVSEEDQRPRRMAELAESLNEALNSLTPESRWEDWQAIARQWAGFTVLCNESRKAMKWSPFAQQDHHAEIAAHLDPAFIDWIHLRYSPLATQKLPTPHHVHHVPYYLSYLHSQGIIRKFALLVMDGMALSDWLFIKQAWQARQSNWRISENLVLAQIPTTTAISRHALISGLRPSDFYSPNGAKITETKAWSAFWIREGLPENAIALLTLNLEKDDPTPEITNPRLQALCLIERQLDEIMHGSVLGGPDHQASVELWLEGKDYNSARLESVINKLLGQDFTVFITSDHGHCEAVGIGAPAEGLTAQSRGQRVRLYTDHRAAEKIQSAYERTMIWDTDGLLPKNLIAVLPTARQAFVDRAEIIVTHGGITIDEVVVPLIEVRMNER